MSRRENNIHNRSNIFPAGKYWIGDLCYVIADWNKFCDMTINDEGCLNGEFPWKSGNIWFHHTAWGDGSYTDCQGLNYGVDAGLIGIIPIELIDRDDHGAECGHYIDFTEAFHCMYYCGEFRFGNVVAIETDPQDDDDEDSDHYGDHDDDEDE